MKIKFTTIIIILLIFLTIGILLFLLLSPRSNFVNKNVFPAVALVNNVRITEKELNSRTQAARNLYEKQNFAKMHIRVDFSTPEGQKKLKFLEKLVFNKLIEDAMIKYLANKNGIFISDRDADIAFERATKNSEPEAVKIRMGLYGLNKSQFEEYVIKPELYRNRLEDWFMKNNKASKEQLEKIKKAEKELQNGVPFAEVAKKYSEGITAKDGGKVGFFQRNHMVKEVADVAFSMKKGEVSPIIESSLGLHIIYIDDILKDETTDDTAMVSVSEIIVRKGSFIDYIDKNIKNAKVKINSPEYIWNKERGIVEFADRKLQEFEEATLMKSLEEMLEKKE